MASQSDMRPEEIVRDLAQDDALLLGSLLSVRKSERPNVLRLLPRGSREVFRALLLAEPDDAAGWPHAIQLTPLGERVAQLCSGHLPSSLDLLPPDEFARRMAGENSSADEAPVSVQRDDALEPVGDDALEPVGDRSGASA